MLPPSTPADRAHLRSHSGPGAGAALCGAPTSAELVIAPLAFHTLVLERLRLALALVEVACEGCGRPPDARGQHRAACMRSGRVKRRAAAPEAALARVCREAGAVVRTNAKLRDMNLGIAAADERAVEVLAQGLPLRAGAQLAVDITVRSVLTGDGTPRPRAADTDGVVASSARADKEARYPELVAGGRCVLVVLAVETGGRWSSEAVDFVEELAHARSRDAPTVLRWATLVAWRKRWTRLLSVACARAFADSLVVPPGDVSSAVRDGAAPALCDLLGEDRF